MQIFEKQISELIPYDNNPRNNRRAVKGVAKSIETFGFKVPMVIDKDNVIVCGHTRYLAAKKLGMHTVPCIIADDLTPEQIKAFRLADNKVSEAATWNEFKLHEELAGILDIDMTDFDFDYDFDFEQEQKEAAQSAAEDKINARDKSMERYNLFEYDPARAEMPWGIPIISRCDYVPDDLWGFNYLLNTKENDIPKKTGLHFFLDDYQFERVWNDPDTYIEKCKSWACVCSPGFSLYYDMPPAMQLWNVFRNRLLGQMMQDSGLIVIPTVLISGPDTYDWAFAGIEPGGTIAVTTTGMNNREDEREMWHAGMDEAIRRLHPGTILVYGDDNGYDFGSINIKRIRNHTTERTRGKKNGS